jgi:hypothetical protein
MVDEALVKLGESFSSTILTLRPTIIVACDPDGSPLDDTVPEPLYTFAPGTTHIQALEQAGYTIG